MRYSNRIEINCSGKKLCTRNPPDKKHRFCVGDMKQEFGENAGKLPADRFCRHRIFQLRKNVIPSAMTHPNILWICTDQQRSDSLGCSGNETVNTPNLDRLAASGTRFARHHTPMQICSPSRATLFTGLYPRNHGLITNGRALDPSIPTLTESLAKSGYSTHSVGKQHLQPILAPAELDMPDSRAFWKNERSKQWTGPYYGFQTLDLLLGESDTAAIAGHYSNWLKENHAEAVKLLQVDAAAARPPEDLDEIWRSAIPAELHYNSWITRQAIRFIEQAESRHPFFLFVSYPDPHHPFAPPAEYADRYPYSEMPLPRADPGELDRLPDYYSNLFPKGQGFRKLYWAATDDEAGSMITTEEISDRSMQQAIAHTYGMIEMIDEGVGKIMRALEGQSRADNTIVVFTSDHGELLGTHGLLHKGPPPYRQLTEISLIMSGPGIGAGQTTHSLSSHLDLVPTMFDLTGIPHDPENTDGNSLAPLLGGESSGVREYLFGEYHPTARNDVYNQTVQTLDWRLTIYPNQSQWGELFHLKSDPDEHWNLYHEPAFRNTRCELSELLAKEFPPNMDVGGEMLCKW